MVLQALLGSGKTCDNLVWLPGFRAVSSEWAASDLGPSQEFERCPTGVGSGLTIATRL